MGNWCRTIKGELRIPSSRTGLLAKLVLRCRVSQGTSPASLFLVQPFHWICYVKIRESHTVPSLHSGNIMPSAETGEKPRGHNVLMQNLSASKI